jgi:UDP-2,3-diacylglucosamine hydrolase
MSRYFISDLHLDSSRSQCIEGFLRYLHGIQSGDQLYILGDLFEAWLGDDDDNAFTRTIADALQTCAGTLYFMHGNRYFLVGEAFAQRCGLTLLPEIHQIMIGNESILLLHGDSLCTDDAAYMKIRPMLRDPNFQQQLLAKPILERQAIALDARAESQAHTSQTALAIMDVAPQTVRDVMQAQQCRTLIHGHTHRPFDHQSVLEEGSGRRLVLGDWGDHGWHICEANDALILESFAL